MESSKEEIEHVHIVFLGGRNEHVDIALSEMDATALHIITSDQYEKESKAHMDLMCKKHSIRQGTVQVVDDIFEQTAVQSLVAAVLRIVKHESELGVEDINWLVGITGGTQLMGAVGAYAANLVGGTPYYVSRMNEGSDFLTGGTTIMFPELGSLNSLHEFKQNALRDLLEKGEGTLVEVVEKGDDLFKLVRQLRTTGLIVVDEEEKQWRLTEIGKATVAVALDGPEGLVVQIEDELEDEEEADPIDEIGECITIFKEVSDHNCYCPVASEALRIYGLTVRAELWSWEEQDYLLLRTYDSTTGEAEKLDSKHPLYSSFEEKRIVADMKTLVSKFLDWRFSFFLDRAGISKNRIAALISADNPALLVGLLGLVWMVEKDLIPASDIKLGDSGVDR